MKAFRDPLYIRILSGLFFACAFIWVAIRYFQVDVNVIWVFLIMSVIFVAGLIVLGLVFSVVLRLLRRRRGGGLLGTIDLESAEDLDRVEAAADDGVPVSAETDATQNR
ncbi:MAG: type VI protein secretion system component VasK [Candidatus Azotimanducaceae bacterium]